MPRTIVGGLIQLSLPPYDPALSPLQIRDAMFEKHLPYIEEAGKKGVQVLCLQEIFNTPYFCPAQEKQWFDTAEAVPGPTTDKLAVIAKKYEMVIVVPVYEREM